MFKIDEEDRDSVIDYWISSMYPKTDTEAATCHLLFSLLAQNLLKGVKKEKQNPLFWEYLEYSDEFIKDSLKEKAPERTSYDRTLATFCLSRALDGIVDSTKDKTSYPWLYLQAVKEITENHQDLFEDKTFREAFGDVKFNDRGWLSSPTAESLVKDYIEQAKEDIENDYHDEDPYSNSPLYYYEEHWDRVQYVLRDMSFEKCLIFHAISLLLCRKCLEPKSFTKYQKAVVKAFSANSGNFNQHQKDFALRNVNETFEKLKEKVLERIGFEYEHMFDDGSDMTFDKDRFTLATDIALEEVSLFDEDEVENILKNLTQDSENFYANPQIEAYCQKYYDMADLLTEEALEDLDDEDDEDEGYHDEDQEWDDEDELHMSHPGEGTEDDKDSEEEESEEEIPQTKEEFQEVMKSELASLDTARDFFFHVIYLKLLMEKDFPFEVCAPYHKVVKDGVEAFKESKNSDVIEGWRKKMDNAFSDLLGIITEKVDVLTIEDDFDERYRFLFPLHCLSYIFEDIPTIYSEGVEKALKSDLYYDNQDGVYFNLPTDAYSLKYLTLTTNELLGYMLKGLEAARDEEENTDAGD